MKKARLAKTNNVKSVISRLGKALAYEKELHLRTLQRVEKLTHMNGAMAKLLHRTFYEMP